MYKNLIINAVAIVPSRVKAKNNVDQAKTNAIGDPNGPQIATVMQLKVKISINNFLYKIFNWNKVDYYST